MKRFILFLCFCVVVLGCSKMMKKGPEFFQDFEEGNGSAQYFWNQWNSNSDFSLDPVQAGKRSVRVICGINGERGGTVGVNAVKPVDLSQKANFVVWVYDIQGTNTVELKLKDSSGKTSDALWSQSGAMQNQWTKITWPLAAMKNVDTKSVTSIELYEWNAGTFYFDTIGWE